MASEARAVKSGGRLGRGLSSLLGDAEPAAAAPADAQAAPIEQLRANPNQPRRTFNEEQLEELAASIRSRGLLQPILVRPIKGEAHRYEIVAGERRWRAAQRAQLHEVPIVVRDLSDMEVVEASIIENVQRADLNAIEEANAYKALMEEFLHTQEQVAEAVGKSRSHVANLLRLLNLPTEAQDMLIGGQLSMGHARALLTAENPLALAREVIEKKFNVRETEQRAKVAEPRPIARRKRTDQSAPEPADADTRALEADLANALGLNVQIRHGADEQGEVVISYATLEQLDEVCRRLCQTAAA